jgi:hypothetical protein
VQDVATKIAFRHRLDDIPRKPGAEQCLQLQFQAFALRLLRSLLRLALEVLDLPLHRGNLLLLFHYLELQPVLGFLLGLVANHDQRCLNLAFDGQVHLALGIIAFPLLANELNLGLLGLAQLQVTLFEHLSQVGRLFGLLLKIGRDKQPCLVRLFSRDLLALSLDLCRDLLVD